MGLTAHATRSVLASRYALVWGTQGADVWGIPHVDVWGTRQAVAAEEEEVAGARRSISASASPRPETAMLVR